MAPFNLTPIKEEGFQDEVDGTGQTEETASVVATRVCSLARGQGAGRYRQVMDVTGINTGVAVQVDPNTTIMEEYNNSMVVMRRQRRWIRCLSILSLALAIDVIYFSVTFHQNKTKAKQEQRNEQATVALANTTNDSFETPPNWAPLPESDQAIKRLAFGSCSSQYMPQPYFDTLMRLSPDVLVLGGNNVYGECTEASCEELRTAYRNWTQHASFQGAINNLPVVATLDDHDYGMQYAHKTNPYKRAAKTLFHDFYHHLSTAVEPEEEDGVYQVYTWGPPGKRVQVILLDTRYHRDPFPPNSDSLDSTLVPPEAPFKPSTAAKQQMLSFRQWVWLEQVLKEEDVQLRLLVSSIQVLSDGTGFEAWRHLPKERDRLFNLLRNECASPIYLLSGNRRVGGFYQYDFEPFNATSRSPLTMESLVEATASSWTHTIPYGAYSDCSDPATCDEEDPSRISDFIRENNFATVEIDWEQGFLTLALRRAETPPGFLYHGGDHNGISSTGQILQSRSYRFM